MAERGRSRWLLGLLAAVALAGVVFFPHNPLTRQAQGYAEGIAVASAATYVSLRTVNAFLSTAQEVEVGGALVVSGTAQPLKWLEPVDDTIERIADMVFGVMVATGLLAVAMGPVGALGWGLVLAALAIWALPGRGPHGFARALAAYGGFLGLMLPLSFLLAALLAGPMTRQVQERNDAVVAELTGGLGVEAMEAAGDPGWLDAMRERLGGIDQYRELAGSIYANADALIGSYIALLAVYLFKVFLLPLLLAGGFLILTRHVAEGRVSR